MLHLFRRLRSKFLAKNQISRYLVYALGEIILIVVGILIALYINNSQETVRDLKMEESYLLRLEDDLNQNLKELDRVIAETARNLNAVDSVVALGRGHLPSMEPQDFWHLSGGLLEYTIFQAAEATVDDIMGSGRLDIIKNREIREAIAGWKTDLISIRSLEEDYKATFNMLLAYYRKSLPIYKYYGSQTSEKISKDEMEQILADFEFLNLVSHIGFPAGALHQEYVRQKIQVMELQKKVHVELKRFPKRDE
ncbi:DUF6090 family protein [Robiginitalea sp. M366]|uniref:DUF6090 family protein n=1 Tax=Robiginitalea aestuariiviva TaxID=3036903 RepID=UPI00240E1D35|nr:DUF6090 family protein [Robiginitalea aestuariiviva]MDG1572026.1 DUF6090 family protein [Robiginitalea aestuariiviva]